MIGPSHTVLPGRIVRFRYSLVCVVPPVAARIMFDQMDQILPLAFSLHSGPGTYALLLGSGVSRVAGIPTGWDVTVDLIGKLSAAVGEAEEAWPDPAVWYRERYKEEPDYSRVVHRLAGSPEDRRRGSTAAPAREMHCDQGQRRLP